MKLAKGSQDDISTADAPLEAIVADGAVPCSSDLADHRAVFEMFVPGGVPRNARPDYSASFELNVPQLPAEDSGVVSFEESALSRLGYSVKGELEIVGRGGMGVVYKANTGDFPIAVKIARDVFCDRTFRERVSREVEAQFISSELNGVTPCVRGVIYGKDSAAIVMDYFDGEPLDHYARDSDPLLVMDALIDAAEQLHKNHEFGLVHRDVKPSNILVGAEGVAIIDFGVVQDEYKSSIDREAHIVGTYNYLAPESIESRSYTSRSDQYSLCLSACVATIGRLPFPRYDDVSTLFGLKTGSDFKVSKGMMWCNGYPAGLADVINKGMSRDPEERYTSCSELADAIRCVRDTYVSSKSEETRPVLVEEVGPGEDVLYEKLPVEEAGAVRPYSSCTVDVGSCCILESRSLCGPEQGVAQSFEARLLPSGSEDPVAYADTGLPDYNLTRKLEQ